MSEAGRPCVVITTCETAEEADKLAKLLIDRRLAACVQITDIRSYYHWKGVVNNSAEKQLLIKTFKSCYPELECCIQENHSYETPEIIQLPIEAASSGYLAWMHDEIVTTDTR